MTVEYVAHMGDDLLVANVARVSFAKWHTALDDSDIRLIAYLSRNGHWTPFAHPQISLRVTAPIFVARQLAKSQVGLVWNEVSRRYVDSQPEFYVPAWRSRPEKSIKQGSGEALADPQLRLADALYCNALELAQTTYEKLLGLGVAPEQARAVLPVATMTQWVWTGSLYAFARVCRQRLDGHAQVETREVALDIARVVEPLFPVSWQALLDGVDDESVGVD